MGLFDIFKKKPTFVRPDYTIVSNIFDVGKHCGKFVELTIDGLNFNDRYGLRDQGLKLRYYTARGEICIEVDTAENNIVSQYSITKTIFGLLLKTSQKGYILKYAFVNPTDESFRKISYALAQLLPFGTISLPGGGISIYSHSSLSVPELVIPERINEKTVCEIANRAFERDNSITSLRIADSVKIIGDRAFEQCENITSIVIGDGVEEIKAFAFSSCFNLQSVHIGREVRNIDKYAFSCCYKLTSISVDRNNRYFCSEDGVLFSKNKEELVLYPNGIEGKYHVPEGTKIICEKAFEHSKLEVVTLPDSVLEIQNSAFESARSLKSINVPATVKKLEISAFFSLFPSLCAEITVEEGSYAHKELAEQIEALEAYGGKKLQSHLKVVKASAQKENADKSVPLGRDESKHIKCGYEKNHDACPKQCAQCAIAIKTDGDMAVLKDNLDEAIRCYKRALFIEPQFAEAYVNLGNAYGLKGEHNNALQAFEKACKIDPVYGHALLGQAISLKHLGKNTEALAIINKLLELYGNNKEVLKLKKDLGEERNADEQDTATGLVEMLAAVKQNILTKHQLVNVQIPEYANYTPEQFTKEVYRYCLRKYASLGMDKVLGECIITSYYGAICAVLLYSKEPIASSEDSVFQYLNNHVDVEYTDVNAERLLGTKAGQQYAESIWEIISPFVSCSVTMFKNEDELYEESVRDGMKGAYEIGTKVAVKHLGLPQAHRSINSEKTESKSNTAPHPADADLQKIKALLSAIQKDETSIKEMEKISPRPKEIIEKIKSTRRQQLDKQRAFNQFLISHPEITGYMPIIIDVFRDHWLEDKKRYAILEPVEVDITKRLQNSSEFFRSVKIGENSSYELFNIENSFLRKDKHSGEVVFLGDGHISTYSEKDPVTGKIKWRTDEKTAAVYNNWLYWYDKPSMLSDVMIYRRSLDGQKVEKLDILSNTKEMQFGNHMMSDDSVRNMYTKENRLIIDVFRSSLNRRYQIVITDNGQTIAIQKHGV